MSMKQDIITNNLANASTVGFRKESMVVSSFSDVLNRQLGNNGMRQTPEGIKFTRAGTFHLSTDGHLVTADGSFLLGQKGPIKVSGTDFKVTDDGSIQVDGKEIDRLLVSTFEDGNMMKKAGDTNFAAPDGGVKATSQFSVKQGYVEMGNLNSVQEMVDLLMVMRNFEANQKALQSHDQRLQKAANELGKVR